MSKGSFKVKTLEDALKKIGTFGRQPRDLLLVLWVSTSKECKPIAKLSRLVLAAGMGDEIAKDVIRGIDSKVKILTLIDEKLNAYHVTETIEFANKSCGV